MEQNLTKYERNVMIPPGPGCLNKKEGAMAGKSRLSLVSGIGLLIVFAPAPGGARAAPQILDLVASAEPVTLTCRDGACTAEFSAFYLQKHRTAPRRRTAHCAKWTPPPLSACGVRA